MTIDPLYTHDCDECIYIGRLEGHDMYYCQGSIIARFGTVSDNYAALSIEIIIAYCLENPKSFWVSAYNLYQKWKCDYTNEPTG